MGVLLPSATQTINPRRSDEPSSPEQALVGLGGGVTVRELRQDTPFSLVALTGGDLTGTSTRVRAKRPDGSWGAWYQTESRPLEATRCGRPARHRPGVRRHHDRAGLGQPARRRPTQARAENGTGPDWDTSPPPRNTLWGRTSPRSSSRRRRPRPDTVEAAGRCHGRGRRRHHRRAEWGADDSVHCGNRQFDHAIRAAVVHHTAGSNDY